MVKNIQTSKKAPPPFVPATQGNFQIFPKPTAEPAKAAIAPNLDLKPILWFEWCISDLFLTVKIKQFLFPVNFAIKFNRLNNNVFEFNLIYFQFEIEFSYHVTILKQKS